MRRTFGVLVAASFLEIGCGGGSATQPNPGPQASTWTISGTLTTTLTGEPVPGGVLNFGSQIVTTTSAGRWTLTGSGTASGTFDVEVAAAGYVTRKTSIRAENGRDVTIDLIRDGGDFSLAFYRQLIRNIHDQPGHLELTRRWTVAPRFYINTFNPMTNEDISNGELAAIVRAIRDVVPQASGGMFQDVSIESGSGSRFGLGSIEVSIVNDPQGNYCGMAPLAWDPGWIKINAARCSTRCAVTGALAQVVPHEVGHAMGLYHTNEQDAVMNATWATACGRTSLTTMERHHARILYARPVGNADIDWDRPPIALAQGSLDRPAPVIRCFQPRRRRRR